MSKFFKCTCGSEAIEIEVDPEFESKYKMNPSMYISLWRLGNFGRVMTFKERLRWIWHILRTGMPWTDSITFDYSKAKEFRDAYNLAYRELAVSQLKYEIELEKETFVHDGIRQYVKIIGGLEENIGKEGIIVGRDNDKDMPIVQVENAKYKLYSIKAEHLRFTEVGPK